MDREQMAIRNKLITFLVVSFVFGWALQFLAFSFAAKEQEELSEVIVIISSFAPLLGVILAQTFSHGNKIMWNPLVFTRR